MNGTYRSNRPRSISRYRASSTTPTTVCHAGPSAVAAGRARPAVHPPALRRVGPVQRFTLQHDTAVHTHHTVLEGQQQRPAGSLHAAQLPDAGQELPIGGPPGSVRLVCAAAGSEGEREHRRGPVAEVDLRQVAVAGREEAGADRQDERHRDLGDDEHVACTGFSSTGRRTTHTVAQPSGDRQPAGPRRCQRGHRESEHKRQRYAEPDRRAIHRGLFQPGHVGGTQRDEDRECRRRQCDPARRRGSRDQQRLQQVGAEQASPTDPERALHRHVAPARLRPHDQQSGHVGAGNQQQQRHAAQENEQGRFGVAEDVVRQRRHDHAPCAPPGEVRFPQSRHDDVHLRPPLSQRAARHQAADDVEDPEAALHAGVHLILPEDAGQLPAYRSPYLGAGRELERGRHDTNDGEWLPPRTNRHGRTDHVGVHVEVLPPRRMAQHQHARRLGLVLFRHERATDECLHTERVEERGGDRADGQPDRRILLDLHLSPGRRSHRGHVHERPGLRAPVLEVRQRHLDVRVVAAVVLLPHHHQLVLDLQTATAEGGRHPPRRRARSPARGRPRA